MAAKRKYSVKKIVHAMVWVAIGSGAVALLIAAISRRNSERCTGVAIHIQGNPKNEFITSREVWEILRKENKGTPQHKLIHNINLASIEASLDSNAWVNKAEVYFDNNNMLEVSIAERVPVARVFTVAGTSFYLDSSQRKLPLNDEVFASVPVFTDFPDVGRVIPAKDSLLVEGISTMAQYVLTHPFWMAQIEQVHINPDAEFDLVTKLGDQVVHFGTVEDMEQKFGNLLCFYKEVLARYGWTKYSEINVKFKGQVVATRRGAQEVKMDSMRSVEIMKALIENAQKQSNEDNSIQLSPQIEDNSSVNVSKEVGNTPDENNMRISVTPPVHVPEKPKSGTENSHDRTQSIHSTSPERPNPFPHKSREAILKRRPESESIHHRKPKAVMPPQSQY